MVKMTNEIRDKIRRLYNDGCNAQQIMDAIHSQDKVLYGISTIYLEIKKLQRTTEPAEQPIPTKEKRKYVKKDVSDPIPGPICTATDPAVVKDQPPAEIIKEIGAIVDTIINYYPKILIKLRDDLKAKKEDLCLLEGTLEVLPEDLSTQQKNKRIKHGPIISFGKKRGRPKKQIDIEKESNDDLSNDGALSGALFGIVEQ